MSGGAGHELEYVTHACSTERSGGRLPIGRAYSEMDGRVTRCNAKSVRMYSSLILSWFVAQSVVRDLDREFASQCIKGTQRLV